MFTIAHGAGMKISAQCGNAMEFGKISFFFGFSITMPEFKKNM